MNFSSVSRPVLLILGLFIDVLKFLGKVVLSNSLVFFLGGLFGFTPWAGGGGNEGDVNSAKFPEEPLKRFFKLHMDPPNFDFIPFKVEFMASGRVDSEGGKALIEPFRLGLISGMWRTVGNLSGAIIEADAVETLRERG